MVENKVPSRVERKIPSRAERVLWELSRGGHRAYVIGEAALEFLEGDPTYRVDILTDAGLDVVLRKYPQAEVIQGTSPRVELHQEQASKSTRYISLDPDVDTSIRISFFPKEQPLREALRGQGLSLNAIALRYNGIPYDPFNGYDDFKAKILRLVCDPDEYFQEDPLRLLQVISFACTDGFKLDTSTTEAIKRNAHLAAGLNAYPEFRKIIRSDRVTWGLKLMVDLHLMDYLIPEIIPCIGFRVKKGDLWQHTLTVISKSCPAEKLRLAALFHDVGKPLCREVTPRGKEHFPRHSQIGQEIAERRLTELGFPQDVVEAVGKLVRYHMYKKMGVKTYKKLYLEFDGRLLDLLDLFRADGATEGEMRRLEQVERHAMRYGTPFRYAQLAVTWQEVAGWIASTGAELSRVMRQLLLWVYEHSEDNTKERLRWYYENYLRP